MDLISLRSWLLISAIVVLILFTPNSTVDIKSGTGGSFALSATGLTVQLDFGNDTVREFENIEADNALAATESVATLEIDWYGNLAYVTSIEGVESDSVAGLWWQYWVNGELASVAANLYEVEDNDTILWQRTSSAVGQEPIRPLNTSLIIGVPVVALIGILFLVILIKRRN
ncbi:MAG: DUF4430 domain-containing protein [Candidatus Thorarchaeota archaeon]|jgi:hypothetical protein